MKITHLGYEIHCDEIDSWDFKFRSNHLVVSRATLNKPREVLVSIYWPGKMKDGIKEGVKLVDKHVKAMTISHGKG